MAYALIAAVVAVGVAVAALAWWRGRSRGEAGTAPAAVSVPAPVPAGPADASLPVPAGEEGWALPLLRLANLEPGADPAQEERYVQAAVTALGRFSAQPQRLPRRPQLLPQLLGALNDEESSARDLAGLIARDPGLAGTLLRVANSPLYRLQALPVESLDRAVALVGTQGLRQLVAVALMQPVMSSQGGAFGRMPELVWEHTQRCSQEIGRSSRGQPGDDVFAAQLLAMLHGLGAIVVLRTLGQEVAPAEGRPAPETLAALLQQWAPRIGQLLAREWQLSERMQQALAELADPALAPGALASQVAAACVRAAADMQQPASEHA